MSPGRKCISKEGTLRARALISAHCLAAPIHLTHGHINLAEQPGRPEMALGSTTQQGMDRERLSSLQTVVATEVPLPGGDRWEARLGVAQTTMFAVSARG